MVMKHCFECGELTEHKTITTMLGILMTRKYTCQECGKKTRG